MFVDYITKLERENELLQKERVSMFKLLYSIKGNNRDIQISMQQALEFLTPAAIKSYALKTFEVVSKVKDAQEHFSLIKFGNDKVTKVVTWRKPGVNKEADMDKEAKECLFLFSMIWDNYHTITSNKPILHLILDIKEFTV